MFLMNSLLFHRIFNTIRLYLCLHRRYDCIKWYLKYDDSSVFEALYERIKEKWSKWGFIPRSLSSRNRNWVIGYLNRRWWSWVQLKEALMDWEKHYQDVKWNILNINIHIYYWRKTLRCLKKYTNKMLFFSDRTVYISVGFHPGKVSNSQRHRV